MLTGIRIMEQEDRVDLGEALNPPAVSYLDQIGEDCKNDDFTGIEDVGKLYGAYKGLKEGSVRIPGKDSSPEDVKAFFSKIGMPESKEGYELSDFDLDKDEIAPIKGNFLESAYKSGLTKYQAKTMWKHEAAAYSAFRKGAEEGVKKLSDTLDQRYSQALSEEYPDEAKRAERITREKNVYADFVAKYGVGDYFSKTGLSLNPAFMHAIAKVHESAMPPSGGSGSRHDDHLSEAEELRRQYPSMF